MLTVILGFFGYVKIPLDAVRLSIANEEFLKSCAVKEDDPTKRAYFNMYALGQSKLTEFLRAGRKLQ